MPSLDQAIDRLYDLSVRLTSAAAALNAIRGPLRITLSRLIDLRDRGCQLRIHDPHNPED